MGLGFGFGLEFQSARVGLVCGWLGWLARVCIVDVGLADVAFVWRGVRVRLIGVQSSEWLGL